jgi:hypothetical protein
MKPAPRRPRGCIFFFMALQLTAEHIRLQKNDDEISGQQTHACGSSAESVMQKKNMPSPSSTYYLVGILYLASGYRELRIIIGDTALIGSTVATFLYENHTNRNP